MVLFGAAKIGNFVYVPSVLPKLKKPVQLDTILPHEAKMTHYSESSLVSAITVGQGPFGNEFPYIRGDDFPPASDATTMGNSVVYVSGRSVYITDPGFPGNIVASNVFEVPCETDLTAVAHQLGALWLFSAHETWRYQPSSGAIKSMGRLEKVSEDIGCSSSSLCLEVNNNVFWADSNGIHTAEGLTVNTLTSNVEPLFRSALLNPMTSYYADSGYTSLASEQPSCQWSFDSKRASLTFSPRYRVMMLSIPEHNAVLVGGSGRWSMWSTESQVHQSGGVDAVGVTRNISNPWMLADGDDLFMVGGPDEEAFSDTNGTPFNVTSKSFYVLEYGKGGALDRTTGAPLLAGHDGHEDARVVAGCYEMAGSIPAPAKPGGYGIVVLGKPAPVPEGTTFLDAGGGAAFTAANTFLVPMYMIPPAAFTDGVVKYTVKFNFDNANWRPVFYNSTTSALRILLPSERLASECGYHPALGLSLPPAAACWATGGAFVDRDGDQIEISFDATKAPASGTVGSWTPWDTGGGGAVLRLNVAAMRPNLMMWIPMHRKTADATSGIAWSSATGVATVGTLYNDSTSVLTTGMLWREWNTSPLTVPSLPAAVPQGKAQAVDWCYKTPSIGLSSGDRGLLRGLAIRTLSHGGDAAHNLYPTWGPGLLNTLSSADLKEYSSQIIDYSGKAEDATDKFVFEAIERMINQATIQTRVAHLSGGSQQMLYAIFDGGAEIVWADPATKLTGNVLIGDEEVFEKRTSEFLKGSSLSSMIFGHAQQRGVRLVFDSLRLLIREHGRSGPMRRKRTS